MVLMDVKLANIYGFEDFHLNLSYPRRLANSTIENEFLLARPNFKYKKAIILMGANATGKTTLGKALNCIFNYMSNGNPEALYEMIGNPSRPAHFKIEFVNTLQYKLIRFFVKINPPSKRLVNASPVVENYYSSCDIRLTDSYESCVKQLDSTVFVPIQPLNFNALFVNIGYRFCLAGQQNLVDINVSRNRDLFLKTLRCIIQTLDPSFTSVNDSKEFSDSFVLKRGSTQILIQKGVLQDNKGILSTGTREGISIAILLAAVKQHLNGFYYCDEQFSHIQTDLEKRLFGMMVSSLGDGEQLFFTSHNSDMQDMNLPKHTFVYLVKEKREGYFDTYAVSASDYLKRPTDSVRSAAENDVFSTVPDDSLLDIIDSEDNDG